MEFIAKAQQESQDFPSCLAWPTIFLKIHR